MEYEFDRYGRIRDIWIARKPPGFAFVEFDDPRDAKDAVRGSDGRYVLDKRVRVEISTRRGGGSSRDRPARETREPRPDPRRTEFRVKFTNLNSSTSWQNLKDLLRDIGCIPVYCDVFPGGVGLCDFNTESDANRVVDKLDDTKFEGSYIRASRDYEPITVGTIQAENDHRERSPSRRESDRGRDRDGSSERRDRSRSRSRDRHGEEDRHRSDRGRSRSRSRSH